MKIIILLASLLLTGCELPELPKPPEKPPNYGEKRLEIFYKCLELARQTQESTHYNDADEVVAECGSQSWYLANSLQ